MPVGTNSKFYKTDNVDSEQDLERVSVFQTLEFLKPACFTTEKNQWSGKNSISGASERKRKHFYTNLQRFQLTLLNIRHFSPSKTSMFRRINTETKAKIIAAVWGTEINQFLDSNY